MNVEKVGTSFALLLVCAISFAGETRPAAEADLRRAIQRGQAVRKQSALVPGVLHKYELVMKAGDVRCGHARVEIEDAKGEGGATYRLRESFKAAVAEAGESAVIDYSGTFLLSADLGLISGKMEARSESKSAADAQKQTRVRNATLSLQDDKLVFELAGEGGKEARKSVLPLSGVRPVPKNALLAIAQFAAREKEKFSPDVKDPFCVPAFDVDWESDLFQVEAAWVSFDLSGYTHPKGSVAQMRVRYLAAEITDKGLEVEPPAPQLWQAVQVWPLDAQYRPLAHPAPDDPRISVESVDLDSIDTNAPLDLDKIEKALQAQN